MNTSIRIRNRVNSLYHTIDAAHTELEHLRLECEHPSHQIGVFKDRLINDSYLQNICDICDTPLGPPTDEEASEFDDLLKSADDKETIVAVEAKS